MEKWLKDVKSWDICDGLCSNLFRKTKFAFDKAIEWSYRKAEFEKRAGFVMMAVMAVHDKTLLKKDFDIFLNRIVEESTDERNFVKKAVNWALRQIGKRDYVLHAKAIKCAEKIKKLESKSARWIASDALREFSTETTQSVLKRRNNNN
jgi:3-methyladenine DNA glycosylase AlkD